MKKLLTILLAIALVLALAAPAFAAKDEDPIFGTEVVRVANDPTVEYDEWDIPINVWNALPDNTPITEGDTVTIALNYVIPAEVEGYDPRLTSSIEFVTDINGLSDIEVVEAQGCPGRIECDYDIGICYPIAGEYANVELDGNELTVMGELDSTVHVILRGTATANEVTGTTAVTIGQYRFPAQFSLCTVDKTGPDEAPCYNAHWSDFFLVQKRAVEFHTEDGVIYDMFVGLNNHYFRLVAGDHEIEDFIPVDENWEDADEPLAHDDPRFESLNETFELVKDFFGLCYNQISVADATFIGEGEHYTFEYSYVLGGETPVEPTDEPVEPTEEPVEPTDEPAEPTDEPAEPTDEPVEPTEEPTPNPPHTGAFAIAGIGAAVIAAGVGTMFFRKKED